MADRSESDAATVIRFADFVLDAGTLELRRAGRVVHLAPQPARILVMLASRPGQLVTRDEIRTAVWGDDVHVEFDRALNFAIKQIRLALGDDAQTPRYVETLRGRGYRFIPSIADESPRVDPTPLRRRRAALATVSLTAAVIAGLIVIRPSVTAPASSAGRMVVAVLPLAGGGDVQVSEAFTDELIAALARVNPARVAVIAGHSSMAFRDSTRSLGEIGRELGADYLVEGSLRVSDDRARVQLRVVEAGRLRQLWARSYEQDASQLASVRNQAVADIGESLGVPVRDVGDRLEAAVDAETYELYLKGRFFWNRRGDGVPLAIDYFSRALARDPQLAPAHAGLADAYMSLPVPDLAAAEAAARDALRIDPELPGAQLALAHARMHRLDWSQARQLFERVVNGYPNHTSALYVYAEYLLAAGRPEEAIRRSAAAVRLDPISGIAVHAHGTTLYFAGRYVEAAEHFRRALELEPTHRWSRRRLGLSLLQLGQCDEAIREIDAAGPEFLEAAMARARCGRAAEARRLMASTPSAHTRPFTRAMVWTALGDADRAFASLEAAVATHAYDLSRLHVEPALAPLRADPRYAALAARVGPPQDTEVQGGGQKRTR